VLAVRKLARELLDVFEATANGAASGAAGMVAALDRRPPLIGYSGER
jgi:hypothetical protein